MKLRLYENQFPSIQTRTYGPHLEYEQGVLEIYFITQHATSLFIRLGRESMTKWAESNDIVFGTLAIAQTQNGEPLTRYEKAGIKITDPESQKKACAVLGVSVAGITYTEPVVEKVMFEEKSEDEEPSVTQLFKPAQERPVSPQPQPKIDDEPGVVNDDSAIKGIQPS